MHAVRDVVKANLSVRLSVRHTPVLYLTVGIRQILSPIWKGHDQRRGKRGGAAGARATPTLIEGVNAPQHWCSAIGCCPYLLVQFSVSGA